MMDMWWIRTSSPSFNPRWLSRSWTKRSKDRCRSRSLSLGIVLHYTYREGADRWFFLFFAVL
jgi:hypothetical protein